MRKTFFMSLAMVLVSSLVISSCADSASEGQQVTFPDKNLDECIKQALGKSVDEEITTTELATLIEFSAVDKGISNLSGLEYCVNLTHLDLGFNKVSDVSPLGNLTNLNYLVLAHNHHICDISPLAGLTNLTSLFLTHNKISDILPLANLTNLTDLRLWDNQISDISPLANLTNLTYLGIRSNQISDISSLVENSGLDSGDKLYLAGNNLDIAEGSDDMENLRTLEDRGVEVHYE